MLNPTIVQRRYFELRLTAVKDMVACNWQNMKAGQDMSRHRRCSLTFTLTRRGFVVAHTLLNLPDLQVCASSPTSLAADRRRGREGHARGGSHAQPRHAL